MVNFSPVFALSLHGFAAGLGIASILGYFGRLWWCFELFSHFRLQYAVLAGICALVMLYGKHFPGFLFSASVSLFNLALILPLYRRPSPMNQPDASYRILTANILGHNTKYGLIIKMLKNAKPDLALLVEYRHHHHAALHSIQPDFPYTHFLPRDDNYGLALLSRFPLDSSEIIYLNEDKIPVLVANLKLDDHLVTIIGSHPPPPKSQEMSAMRDQQILALARLVAKQTGEVILLGDMNTTSWSYIFHELLYESKLCDSRRGFGVQSTWPDRLSPMRIPIDHILHSPAIQISGHHTGPFSGSDHRPVIVDFYLTDNPHS